MNLGIRDYCKYVIKNVGIGGTAYFNLHQANRDFHLVIPLYESNWSLPVMPELIFSFNDRDKLTEFGKGIRLNYYKRLERVGQDQTKIITYNSDFSQDIYLRDPNNQNKYINTETSTYIETTSLQSPYMKLYDKYGNYISYDISSSSYPISIYEKKRNKICYNFTIDSQGKITSIVSENGESAIFIYNAGLVSQILIKREVPTVTTIWEINLSYTSNLISGITYRSAKDTTKTLSTTYQYDTDNAIFTITEIFTGKKLKCHLNETYPHIRLEESNTNTNVVSEETQIVYSPKKTIYMDSTGTYHITYDTRNFPSNMIKKTADGLIASYQYYDNNKRLCFDSNIQNNSKYGVEGNLLLNSYFEEVNNPWVTSLGQGIMSIVDEGVQYLGTKSLSLSTTTSSNLFGVSQTINFTVKKATALTLNLWGIQKIINTIPENGVIATAQIVLYSGSVVTQDVATIVFNYGDEWQFKSLPIYPTKLYDTIKIELKVIGQGNSVLFHGISLFEKTNNSSYQYDNENNVLTTSYGKRTKKNYYCNDEDSKNIPRKLLNNDSNLSEIIYDDYLQLTEEKTSFGSRLTRTYNDKNNITQEKTFVLNGTDFIQRDNIYNSSQNPNINNEFIIRSIDMNENDNFYTWNELYKILDETIDAKQVHTEYEYDAWNNITKIKISKGTNEGYAQYIYNATSQILEKIILSSGTAYQFNYDNEWKLTEIWVGENPNNINFLLKTYVYEIEEGPCYGYIKELHYGWDPTIYLFLYEDINNITKISGVNIKRGEEDEEELFRYYYDGFGRLKYVYDMRTISYGYMEYKYNVNGEICEIINPNGLNVKYSYENLNNTKNKRISLLGGEGKYYSYDYIGRSKNTIPDYLYNKIKLIYNSNELTRETIVKSCFFSNEVNNRLTYYYRNIANGNTLTELNSTIEYGENLVPVIDNNISCIDCTNSMDRLGYLVNVNDSSNSQQTVMLWFKTNDLIEEQYIISIGNSITNNFIGVQIGDNNNIILKVIDYNGVSKEVIRTSTQVNVNEWNFLCLAWQNRPNMGQGFPAVSSFTIFLNNHYFHSEFIEPNNISFVFSDSQALINIGCSRNNGVITTSSRFNGKISSLIMSEGVYWTEGTIRTYYLELYKYMFSNIYNQENNNILTSATTHHEFNAIISQTSSDIIPLNNNLVSIKGVQPNFSGDILGLDYSSDDIFIFNNEIKRYTYFANNGDLHYNYNLSTQGTIAMRVYVTGNSDYQFLFQNVDITGKTLGLYRNQNKYLCVDFCDGILTTPKILDDNVWRTVSLSWMKTDFTYRINVKISGDSYYEFNVNMSYSFNNFTTYIGRRKERRIISTSESTLDSLLGQIELLTFKTLYSSPIQLSVLEDNLCSSTKCIEYDEFGRIYKKDIKKNSQELLNQLYVYGDLGGGRISNSIVNESITMFNNNEWDLRYTYDEVGNVILIKKNGTALKRYEYNYRNFLIKEEIFPSSIYYLYQYDANGNITSKNKYDFNDVLLEEEILYYTYTNYDDVLTAYKKGNLTKSLTYDSEYIGNPRTYGSSQVDRITYQWEGRKLTSYNGIYFNEEFTYNDNNLRSSKVWQDYAVTPAKSSSNTYWYEGNLLTGERISDALGTRYNYYMYDENNSLYGIIYNSNTYYYIRDILGNILGLMDATGNVVVEYQYDAWGRILSTSGSLALTLGVDNPFKYKGYYYDFETGLYYCNSRYYNPNWGRWLSTDNVDYLDPVNINGLNLFAYCYNNPIGIQYNTYKAKGSANRQSLVSSNSIIANIFSSLSRKKSNLSPLPIWTDKVTTVLDIFSSFAGVFESSIWAVSRSGRAFTDFHYSAYGLNKSQLLSELSSPLGKICNAISIGLIAVDLGMNIYNSVQQDYSFAQGATSFALTATKDIGIYYASSKVAGVVGAYVAGSKLGASLGAWAGPVGIIIGAGAGFAVGYVIDEFGEEIIDWAVGLFD